MQERVGDLLISFPRFRIPGWSDLVIVLNDVLIGAVKSDGERRAGAAGGAFEARIGGDDVIGQNPAIAPTANSQTIRISHAHSDDVIDAGFQVLNFVVAPVRE